MKWVNQDAAEVQSLQSLQTERQRHHCLHAWQSKSTVQCALRGESNRQLSPQRPKEIIKKINKKRHGYLPTQSLCLSLVSDPTGSLAPPPQQQQQQEVGGDSPTCSLDGATVLEVMVPSLVVTGEHVRNRKGSCRSSWGSPTGPPVPPPQQQQQQQEVAGDSPTCSLDGATALEVMVPSLVVITFVTVKDLADQVGDPQRDPELGNKSTAAAATEGGMDSRTRPVVHCWPQVSLW